MRTLMLFATILMAGCLQRPVRLATRDGARTLDELLRHHPADAATNIRADEIDRTVAASLHLVQVRGGETPHRHAHHDLAITVLRGEGEITIDGATQALAAGDVAVVPRGVAHHFVRTGADPAVAFVVFAPPLDAPDSMPVGGVDSPTRPR